MCTNQGIQSKTSLNLADCKYKHFLFDNFPDELVPVLNELDLDLCWPASLDVVH